MLQTIDFYIRLLLSVAWVVFASIYGVIASLYRFGDPRLSSQLGAFFGWGVLRAFKIQLRIEGKEHLQSGLSRVYLGNHQNVLDIPVFSSIIPPRTVAVGKMELLKIPFFGLLFKATGNLVIRRQDRNHSFTVLGDAVRRIHEEHLSLMMFPEGTRNKGSRTLLPFKKGAFHVAREAKIAVVPMVCAPYEKVIDFKKKRVYGGVLTIRVFEPQEVPRQSGAQLDDFIGKTREFMQAEFDRLF